MLKHTKTNNIRDKLKALGFDEVASNVYINNSFIRVCIGDYQGGKRWHIFDGDTLLYIAQNQQALLDKLYILNLESE